MRSLFCSRVLVATSMALLAPGAAWAADLFEVGVSTTLSPPGSVTQGVQARQAIELVADWLNESGGVQGKKIHLVIGDDQGTTEGGKTVAERLITHDQVSAIIGQISSNVVLASIPVARQYNVPVINTNGWASSIRTAGAPQIFSPGPYTSRIVSATVDTLKALGVKTVYGTFDNTDAGFGVQKELTEQMKAKLPGVSFTSVVLDRSSKDFLPAVFKIQGAHPDVVVSEMIAPPAYILLNQLFEQAVAPTDTTLFFDIGGISDNPDFWPNAHESGKDMLAFGHFHPGMDLPPLAKEFRDRFVKRYKDQPGRLSFQAADSLLLLVDAAKRAGSTDPAKLIDALKTTSFDGTRGRITFDQTPGPTYQQWVNSPYAIYQFTKTDQSLDDSTLLKQNDGPLAIAKIAKP
jgi:branched-chain amino acid transport system substrate-binding protein